MNRAPYNLLSSWVFEYSLHCSSIIPDWKHLIYNPINTQSYLFSWLIKTDFFKGGYKVLIAINIWNIEFTRIPKGSSGLCLTEHKEVKKDILPYKNSLEYGMIWWNIASAVSYLIQDLICRLTHRVFVMPVWLIKAKLTLTGTDEKQHLNKCLIMPNLVVRDMTVSFQSVVEKTVPGKSSPVWSMD